MIITKRTIKASKSVKMEYSEDPKPLATLSNLVSREEWGAAPPRTLGEPLINTPHSFVRVFKYSETEGCKTREECVTRVQEIQKRDMEERGMDDIQYNFLIGADGHVYEGRGWTVRPERCEKLFTFEDKYIEITLIGDHRYSHPSDPVFQSIWEVVECGIKNNIIKEDFLPLWER